MHVGLAVAPGREEISAPAYQTEGSAAFDLAAAETVVVMPGTLAMIPTGLILQIPQDHVLLIFARSSLAIKKHLLLANGVGIVDADYCGSQDEIKILVLNMTPEPSTVLKGERIAQGIILPFDRVNFVAYQPPELSRGGFGSTQGYDSAASRIILP